MRPAVGTRYINRWVKENPETTLPAERENMTGAMGLRPGGPSRCRNANSARPVD